jgi:arachidonate 15-lipoxygenase
MTNRRAFVTQLLALTGGGALPSISRAASGSEPAAACPPLTLPQHDPAPFARRLTLAWQRLAYRYNHDYLPGVPMVERVPALHRPAVAWIAQVLVRLINIEVNARLAAGSPLAQARAASVAHVLGSAPAGDPRSPLRRAAELAADTAAAEGAWPGSVADYDALFRSIALPAIAGEFGSDEVFAWLRLAGPNPVMLQRMRGPDPRLPLVDDMLTTVSPGDSLARAIAEGRLFLADYAALDGVETGVVDGLPKYLGAPLAVFVLRRDDGVLWPVAIQCQQQPGPANPVFLPGDGPAWQVAKTVVQIADANVHEAVTHLGRTHLLLEPFAMATERQLADGHPLKPLLRTHFEGTLFINDLAQSFLIAPGGPVETLLAGTLDADRAIAAAARRIPLPRVSLPAALAAREVETIADYPYRDDALPYWRAIDRWCRDFVGAYYRSNDDVKDDFELQAWCRELGAEDGGRVPDFEAGQRLRSRDALAEVLTTLVFTASVQHAAVNFPQYDHMAHAATMPLAGFAPAPVSIAGVGEEDLLAMLPPRSAAQGQLDILYLLGSVHHTRLGDYGPSDLTGPGLCDPRLRVPLARFRRRLDAAGARIRRRNLRRRPYPFLERDGIPASTNI